MLFGLRELGFVFLALSLSWSLSNPSSKSSSEEKPQILNGFHIHKHITPSPALFPPPTPRQRLNGPGGDSQARLHQSRHNAHGHLALLELWWRVKKGGGL